MVTRCVRGLGPMVVLALLGCGALLKASGYPPEALRKTPPAGVEATALVVGAAAPDLTLPDTEGHLHRLGGAADRQRVVVFYRGAW